MITLIRFLICERVLHVWLVGIIVLEISGSSSSLFLSKLAVVITQDLENICQLSSKQNAAMFPAACACVLSSPWFKPLPPSFSVALENELLRCCVTLKKQPGSIYADEKPCCHLMNACIEFKKKNQKNSGCTACLQTFILVLFVMEFHSIYMLSVLVWLACFCLSAVVEEHFFSNYQIEEVNPEKYVEMSHLEWMNSQRARERKSNNYIVCLKSLPATTVIKVNQRKEKK